jgi:WD40 repeat protein
MKAVSLPVLISLLLAPYMRYRVWYWARLSHAGEERAVHELTSLLCTSQDPDVKAAMAAVLQSLRSPSAVDHFCHEVLLRDDLALTSLAIGCGFTPSEPSAQVIFFFVTGQIERLATLDPDMLHPLLTKGYREASKAIRARIQTVAQDSGQSILFTRMCMSPGGLLDPASWSPEEWDLIVNGIAREYRYNDLWSLLFSAPPPTALDILHILQQAGWMPPGDDLSVMEGITSWLPDSWAYPVLWNDRDFQFEPADRQTVRLAFSPDGNLLAAGDCAGAVRIWQTERGTHIPLPLTGPASVRSLAFSHDGEILVVYREDGGLCGHDVHEGSLIWSRPAKGPTIGGCCAAKGDAIITGDHEGTLILTDIRTGVQRTVVRGSGIPVSCLLILHGGVKIAAGYENGSVSVLNTEDCSLVMTIPGTGCTVRAMGEGQGSLIVVCDHLLPACHDGVSGKRMLVYAGDKGPAGCFVSATNESWFSLTGTDNILRIWHHPVPSPSAVIPFYIRSITCCTATVDSTLLVCGCSEGTLRAFRMPDANPLWETKAHDRALATITLSSDGRLLATTGWDGTVSLRDAVSGKILRTLRRKSGAIAGLALTPCGSYAICGYTNGTASLYDCQDGSLVRSFDLYAAQVKAVALSPDGRILASAGGDSTLRLWEVRDGSLIAGLDGLTTTVSSLAFTPGAHVLFAGGWDGKLRLWSVPEGRLLATRPGHSCTITCCAVTDDGTLLVTGSNDKTAAIWSLPGLERLATIPGSRSEVSALAISPAGDLFATGNSDAVIRLFRLPSGANGGSIPAMPGKVTTLVFTPDGNALVVGYDTGTIAVYTCPAGCLIHSTGAHPAAVRGLALVHDGSSVISADEEGGVQLIPLPWTRPLSATILGDIPRVAAQPGSGYQSEEMTCQLQFLRGLLAARFRHEIGLCPLDDGLEAYDIQIVG